MMKGLLLKEFYVASRTCRSILFVVVVFFALSFFGRDSQFFFLYPLMMVSLLPVTLLSYDERDGWDKYSLTLPCTRAQLVSAKYLIGLIFGGAVFLLAELLLAVRLFLNGAFDAGAFLSLSSALLLLGLLGPSLLMPFTFKFGSEKGRMAYYLVIVLLFAAIALLAGMGFYTYLEKFSWLVIAAAVLLYLGSWRLSIFFYEKREL